MKACTVCKEIKNLSEFYKNRRRKDGIHYECKVCVKVRVGIWQKTNKEKVNKKNKEWKNNNRKSESERAMRYYYANREHVLDVKKKWDEKNKEKCSEIRKRYRRNNKEKIQEIETKRRLVECDKLSNGRIKQLLTEQKNRCVYCNTEFNNNFHIDHIYPVALGGLNIDSNVQLLCKSCNSRKGKKTPWEFEMSLKERNHA